MNSRLMIVAGVAAALVAPAAPAGVSFEVGQPFPDLVLPSLADGQPMSLADFRGRKVILQVFASW